MGKQRAIGVIRGAVWGLGPLLAAAAIGCGPGEAKAPNPMRSVDERRAIEIIRRSIGQEGARPVDGRDVRIVNAAGTLHIDVGVEGHQYGVAYLTADEAAQLPEKWRTPNKKDEKLRIVAGEDGVTKVVLLYQQNYVYDDLVGEGHEQTTITAESEISRDVRDFITHAKSKPDAFK
jgi:hypothetical protein